MENRSREAESLADDQILGSFGYRQELRRALKLFSLFAVAFSIISITTGLFTNFGFGLKHLGPAFIWLWPVVAVGQLLVALVVSELGSRIPLAGYSYQWGSRLVNPAYGWFVGFTGLAYLSVGGAAITFVVVAPLVATVLGLDANNQSLLLAITGIWLALSLSINVISVALAARVNNVAVFTEVAGTVIIALVLIVAFGLHPIHPLSFLFSTGGVGGGDLLKQLPYAALIGIFTLVGFELAADLSEEVVGARVTVPRAVLTSYVASVVAGMVTLVGFALTVPDLAGTAAAQAPLVDIVQHWLGAVGTALFVVAVIFSMFALSIVGTAATARLIYAMARDNVLPFSGTLSRVNTRTRTPIAALLANSALTLLFVLAGYVDTVRFGGSAFLVLVTATATLPFVVYLLTVITYVFRRQKLLALPGGFSLGVWGPLVLWAALGWVVLALLTLTIPRDYWGADLVVVVVELVAAVWYLLALRGRLRRGEAATALLAAAASE